MPTGWTLHLGQQILVEGGHVPHPFQVSCVLPTYLDAGIGQALGVDRFTAVSLKKTLARYAATWGGDDSIPFLAWLSGFKLSVLTLV